MHGMLELTGQCKPPRLVQHMAPGVGANTRSDIQILGKKEGDSIFIFCQAALIGIFLTKLLQNAHGSVIQKQRTLHFVQIASYRDIGRLQLFAAQRLSNLASVADTAVNIVSQQMRPTLDLHSCLSDILFFLALPQNILCHVQHSVNTALLQLPFQEVVQNTIF